QCLFFSPAPRDPRPSTFPYTTLFRSVPLHGAGHYPSRLTACYETMTTTVTQMTRRHVSAIVIAVVAVGGATLVTAAPSGLARPASVHVEAGRIGVPDPAGAHIATSTGAAEMLYAAVNAERARLGLPSLAWSAGATAAAQAHAADMAAHDELRHAGSDGSSAGTRLQRAGVAPTAW